MSSVERIQYQAGPLKNVWLQNGYEVSEGKWGTTIKFVDLDGLARALFSAVLIKPSRLSGGEVTYLRHKLDVSQASCANMIGVDEQTLSLWERGKYPIPISSDALFRRICIEQLHKVLTRSTLEVSTMSLVQFARTVIDGVFVCQFNQHWTVQFERSISHTQVETLHESVYASHFLRRIHDQFTSHLTLADIDDSTEGQFDIWNLGNKSLVAYITKHSGEFLKHGSKIVKMASNPTVDTAISSAAINIAGQTYKINPESGAYFPTSTRTETRELHES